LLAVCRLLFAVCCLLFATAAVRNLCSHGAFDKIENSMLKVNFFPSANKIPTSLRHQQEQGHVAESIIKYYAYFVSSNIHFFPLPAGGEMEVAISSSALECLQSLLYLMHKSVAKINKNCI